MSDSDVRAMEELMAQPETAEDAKARAVTCTHRGRCNACFADMGAELSRLRDEVARLRELVGRCGKRLKSWAVSTDLTADDDCCTCWRCDTYNLADEAARAALQGVPGAAPAAAPEVKRGICDACGSFGEVENTGGRVQLTVCKGPCAGTSPKGGE